MFMDSYLNPEKNIRCSMPRLGLPTMTTVEKAYIKIEDESFNDDLIKDTYGVSLETVNNLVKIKKM